MKKVILIKNFHKKIKINNKFIKKVTNKILDYILNSQSIELSILFVDNNYIKMLNKQYRGIDEVTDVLSFPQHNYQLPVTSHQSPVLLGDIVIALDTAQKNAKIYNNELEKEIIYLIIHGILHLLGYTDEEKNKKKEMIKLQNKIMKRLMM